MPKRRSIAPRSPATRTASRYDPAKPVKTSGIRLGTPAGTTRGFGPAEFREIGGMIAEVVDGLRKNGEQGDGQIEASVRAASRRCAHASPSIPEL
jgi:glycine hydroxymethyltransferase